VFCKGKNICHEKSKLFEIDVAIKLLGGVKVSTGVLKLSKRVAVDPVSVKKSPLKRNAKTNNNFALAA